MTKGWNLENSYAHLPEGFFTLIKPVPVDSPELVILNKKLAKTLGLNIESLESEEGIAIFAGNETPPGSIPLAQAYAGHQFGHFTMLGDGRAVLLGEQITPDGKRFDIQLKGSGQTPYSRRGDGRATIGPMLREYIISEAMDALKIPTTRSLAVVATGESVLRETMLPGAVLTRVAASHLRVGTFQYIASSGSLEELKILADYTIKRHFPQIESNENKYLSLLEEVITSQASLIAKWQAVGFIHGVMNTDNMAISGETIDYGPCAFMDYYDPTTFFSSIDAQGRYAYINQPHIAQWNIARLAETLLPLLHTEEEQALKLAQDTVLSFSQVYRAQWLEKMKAKLGIYNEETQDESLIENLLNLMKKHEADFTNTFRSLTMDTLEEESALFISKEFLDWHKQWQERLSRQEETKAKVQELMQNSNPTVIPRNRRVEEALEAAEKHKDYSVMEKLLEVLANPYDYSLQHDAKYCKPPALSTSRSYQTFCGT